MIWNVRPQNRGAAPGRCGRQVLGAVAVPLMRGYCKPSLRLICGGPGTFSARFRHRCGLQNVILRGRLKPCDSISVTSSDNIVASFEVGRRLEKGRLGTRRILIGDFENARWGLGRCSFGIVRRNQTIGISANPLSPKYVCRCILQWVERKGESNGKGQSGCSIRKYPGTQLRCTPARYMSLFSDGAEANAPVTCYSPSTTPPVHPSSNPKVKDHIF